MKRKLKLYVPIFIIFLAFLLRISVLINYGLDYHLNSDDAGYVNSAVRLLENGMLTYHFEDIPTVHLMPGEPFMLAAIFAIFGTTKGLWVAKLVHILIGCATIYVAMLLSKRWVGEKGSWLVGLIGAIFPPFIQVDNLTLTEGPFVLAMLLLIYCSIRLSEKQNMLWFSFVLITYFIALYFRVNIGLYPLVLFLYLWYKKYPKQLFLKQIMISVVALLVVMGPWWIRNYMVFDKFIPLTAGSGDPLLLGTFQGEGYPEGSYSESIQITDGRVPKEDIPARMEERKVEALERMAQWWEDDPVSMLKSYLWLKPKDYLNGIFYWKPVLGFEPEDVLQWYQLMLAVGAAGWLGLGFIRKHRAEVLLIVSFVLMNVAMNSYYFAYPRYNYPLIFIWIIGFVYMIQMAVHGIQRQRRKLDGEKESAAVNYTSIQ